jgi:hypothetical protein
LIAQLNNFYATYRTLAVLQNTSVTLYSIPILVSYLQRGPQLGREEFADDKILNRKNKKMPGMRRY